MNHCASPSCWYARAAYVLAALLALYLLYFAGLGSYPLVDVDEPVYAQVAREMAHGDWLTPHNRGELWFDKPPLFYWLTAAATRLLGPGELASRLPSALMAVILLLWLYGLTRFDFGPRAGFLAVVVMGTCLQQVVLARAAVTDMTLAAALTGALYGLRRWLAAEEGRARVGWGVLAGAMVGLATLTKGPVAMVLVGLTLVVYLALARRLGRLISGSAAAAVGTALVVAVPWYATMYALHGERFVEGFLVANNLVRFLKPEHAMTGGWYSYLLNFPVLAVYFLPWTFFLPQALVRRGRANDGARLAVTWAVVVFVFFSLSKTQLVTYIFPMFPALAVLVGAWWEGLAAGEGGLLRGWRWGVGVGLFGAAVVTAALVAVARAKFPAAEGAAAVLGGILLVSLAGTLVGGWGRSVTKAGRALGAVPAGMVLFTLWLVFAIMPPASAWTSVKPLLDHLPPSSPARVVSFHFYKESLYYYGGDRVEYVDEIEQVRSLLAAPEPVFVICGHSRLGELAVPGTVVWAREGRYELLANPAAARGGHGE